MNPPDSAQSPKTGSDEAPGKWPVLLLAIIVIMVDGFDLQAIGFVAPEIARSWSLPISDFGPAFSAGLAGSMIGAMASGMATRLVGLRLTIVCSLFLFGAATLTTVWISSLTSLIVLRLLVGLGVGAAVPAVLSIVAQHSPARYRSTLVVVTLCGQPIGAILGSALCAHFIPIFGWTFAFYLGGLLPLLLLGAVLLSHGIDRTEDLGCIGSTSQVNTGRLLDLFRPGLLAVTTMLWVCSFLGVFFIYIIVSWLPSSVRATGYSLELSIAAISMFNLGGVAGAVILGGLIDRFGPWRIIPVAFGVAGLSMGTLDLARVAPPLLFSTSFMCGFAGYGGVMSLGALTIMLYPPALRTTGVGWVLGVGRLGAAVGPLGAGFAVAAGMAIGRLFYFAAAAAILVTVCLCIYSVTRPPLANAGEVR